MHTRLVSIHSALLLIAGALAACGPGPEPKPIEGAPRICGQADYDAAVRHAESPTTVDITNDLFAISHANSKIVWSPDDSQVLLVQWTSFTGYPVGGTTVLSRDIFVTAAPQLHDFCKPLTADAQGARLVQYLGLAPEAADATAKRNVVEIWAKPSDLFRPCADPAIDTATCPLTFPAGVAQSHKDWIAAQYASSYGFWNSTKYPWTGLGYTYDWCGTTTNEGGSEYIIKKGSTVTIKALTKTSDYCAQ